MNDQDDILQYLRSIRAIACDLSTRLEKIENHIQEMDTLNIKSYLMTCPFNTQDRYHVYTVDPHKNKLCKDLLRSILGDDVIDEEVSDGSYIFLKKQIGETIVLETLLDLDLTR